MFLLTTSHRPSPRTRSFIKDLASIFPNAFKTNRGHKTFNELAIEAVSNGLNYVIIVSESRGNPRSLEIYEVVDRETLYPKLNKIVSIVIQGVRLSRENPESHKAYGGKSINIDFSKCISDDCFFISDLFMKIYSKVIDTRKPSVLMALDEDKYIYIKFYNIVNKPIGPVIKVLGVKKA